MMFYSVGAVSSKEIIFVFPVYFVVTAFQLGIVGVVGVMNHKMPTAANSLSLTLITAIPYQGREID